MQRILLTALAALSAVPALAHTGPHMHPHPMVTVQTELTLDTTLIVGVLFAIGGAGLWFARTLRG